MPIPSTYITKRKGGRLAWPDQVKIQLTIDQRTLLSCEHRAILFSPLIMGEAGIICLLFNLVHYRMNNRYEEVFQSRINRISVPNNTEWYA